MTARAPGPGDECGHHPPTQRSKQSAVSGPPGWGRSGRVGRRRKWVRSALMVLIAAGAVMRFADLGSKPYWLDETFTSYRVSGYQQDEVRAAVVDGEVRPREALDRFQRPSDDRSVLGTVEGLAADEPQLPPLYFVLARFWTGVFGSSSAATRALSALVGVLALPAMFWLCRELFARRQVAWVATALLAVAPFQIVYAQEARPIILWQLTILASSAGLLRAIRTNTGPAWALYGLLMAAALYAFTLS